MSESPTPALPLWWPSVDEVAAVMARLTIGSGGKAVYAFTDATVPTAVQAQEVVAGVAADVANSAGTDLTAAWDATPTGTSANAARRVIALGAASQLAFSYYPGRDGDLPDRLETRFVAALERLLGGGGSAPDAGGGGDGPAPASPVGGFPPSPWVRPGMPYLGVPW